MRILHGRDRGSRTARSILVALVAAAVTVGTSAQAQAQDPKPGPGTYTIQQTLSDEAQLSTIAFDALGFLTGSLGADSFFPPGKVADFWGFQALRDNDPSGMGHNTDFLTAAALNMLSVLTADQRAALRRLAAAQVSEINQYGYDRFVLMKAFRRLLAGDLPPGTTGLSRSAVQAFSSELYRLDGRISLERAAVMGPMLASLTTSQRATLDAMVGKGMTSWPKATEPADLKGLDRDTKVAVMTYAGDLFSWYAGDVEADVYFCPERQGTYFGSFYLKDAPAVGNPDYSIGTNITGDMGKALLAALTPAQAALITGLVDQQRSTLKDIVDVRRRVSVQLRTYRSGGAADVPTTQALMSRYGSDDGALAYAYATAFAKVNSTLTDAQRTRLQALRTQTVGSFTPAAAYLYASPIAAPTVRNTDFLFGTTASAATPTVALSARSTTVPRGTPVTVAIRTTGDVAGATVVVSGQPAGQASTVLRRVTLTRAGLRYVRLVITRTTRLTASLRDPATGATISSTPITIAVRRG
jgi:hypothetical protein